MKRLAHRRVHGCTGFRNNGLALVVPQPSREILKGLDVVGGALHVRSRVVDVEILVHVKVQQVGAVVGVCNGSEGSGASARHIRADTGKVGCGQQNHLRRGTGLSHGGDDLLAGLGPDVDVQIVGLVHQAKDDLVVLLVVLGNLDPQVDKDIVVDASLADDAAIVPGKVVHVNHAVGAGDETGVNDLVVGSPVELVQLAVHGVVGDELPCGG